MIIEDKNLDMLESIPEVFPDAKYQHYTVHFYRNIFSMTPRSRMKVSVKTYAPSIFKAPLICGAYCSNQPEVSLTTA